MRRWSKVLVPAAVLMLFALIPAQAVAQAELSPFIGYLIGSDIDPDTAVLGISRSFDNSLTWGVRGAYFFEDSPNLGIEGNFSQSPLTGFAIGSDSLDARATYADLNIVVQSAGQNAKFYGTAGMGLTRFRMGASDGGATHTKLGVNFGVGVKVPMWTQRAGRWGLRFDIRDHWHRMAADDSMRSNFRAALALPANSASSIHNVVTTIAAYFQF